MKTLKLNRTGMSEPVIDLSKAAARDSRPREFTGEDFLTALAAERAVQEAMQKLECLGDDDWPA